MTHNLLRQGRHRINLRIDKERELYLLRHKLAEYAPDGEKATVTEKELLAHYLAAAKAEK